MTSASAGSGAAVPGESQHPSATSDDTGGGPGPHPHCCHTRHHSGCDPLASCRVALAPASSKAAQLLISMPRRLCRQGIVSDCQNSSRTCASAVKMVRRTLSPHHDTKDEKQISCISIGPSSHGGRWRCNQSALSPFHWHWSTHALYLEAE